MKRKLFLIIITFLEMGIIISTTSEAIIISFEPVNQNVAIGQQAIVNLFIKDLGDYQSPSLGTFDLYVYYNPTVLSFSGYLLGPYLGNIPDEAWDISGSEILPGTINFAEVSLLWPDDLNAIQPSQFSLAMITFDILALGSSALNLWYQPLMGLGDENGDPLDKNYTVYLQSGNINVVPVPTPILLFSSGLVGIWYLKKNFLRTRNN